MDWKRLFKAIGIALLTLLIIAAVVAWIVIGQENDLVFFCGVGIIVFAVLVSKIYDGL